MLRLLLLLAFLFLSLLILLVVLQLTESALSIWQLLDQMSPVLLAVYAIGLLGFALLVGVVGWLLIRPGRKAKASDDKAPGVPLRRDDVDRAIAEAEASGIDAREARLELEELERRSAQGRPHVVFFGPVSSGKSALIRALTGEAEIEVDARAGTTRHVTHYPYVGEGLPELMLSDAPGILDPDRDRVAIAREEARRADLIVYVCDGELTRDQFAEIGELQRFERPLLLALNKADRYSEAELPAIRQRLAGQLPDIEQVVVQAGGQETVMRVDAEGRETPWVRDRPAKVDALLQALARRFERESAELSRLRDESLVRLGAEKLADVTERHRRDQAERLVKGYARKAMVGAMAAVSPGTDVLIQGYLGVRMVRELAQLYGVKVHQADADAFIEMAGRQVGKRLTLLLALSGNVLKAFPGIGTVTGGLMHAVAYGMIFEGLGQAVARTLSESGDLQRRQALHYFEESMSGDLEGRAKDFARLAWEEFAAKR